jgi:hypothetical protein
LFKLLHPAPNEVQLMKLIPDAALNSVNRGSIPQAMWSLSFGIAQADNIMKSGFVKTIEFVQRSNQKLRCLEVADAIVEVMQHMFPLPVALLSCIEHHSVEKSGDRFETFVKKEGLKNLLPLVDPFYIWSLHPGEQKESIKFLVHIKKPNDESARDVKCVFQGLVGVERQELQNAISNRLHKEFGIVPIAFAEVPWLLEEQAVESASPDKSSEVSTSPYHSAFFKSISDSCMHSTKVLLDFSKQSPEGARMTSERFILQQTLDVFGIYREVAASFFMDLKDELQQSIHGEDKDSVCRAVHKHICRSPAVSIPLLLHEMSPNEQSSLVQSLPDDFLLCKNLKGQSNSGASDAAWSFNRLIDPTNNSVVDGVDRYQHDYDFPLPNKGDQKKNWTTYFEYLYLNCNDDRPYSPCWDPIALQNKANEVALIIPPRQFKSDDYLVSQSYVKFRTLIMDEVKNVWDDIQKDKGYSNRDAILMMNRLQHAMKKVFYFVICCKRIVFCQECCEQFGLISHEIPRDNSYVSKCSNHTSCGSSQIQDGNAKQYPPVSVIDSQKPPKNLHLRVKHAKLKSFCFQWLIDTAFNVKKACSTSFVRHANVFSSFKFADTEVYSINLSSRQKCNFNILTTANRSRLLSIFSVAVELCKSGRLSSMEDSKVHDQIIHTVVMAERVNRVVAECDVLKTGCSVYESFPTSRYQESVTSAQGCGSRRKSPQTPEPSHMTHLIVAAIEGNSERAHQYLMRADLHYIFRDYSDRNDIDPFIYDEQHIQSCALHMALERGHTDVAREIIHRACSLAGEEFFDYHPNMVDVVLDHLFLGASFARNMVIADHEKMARFEIPTSFMYLARYSMIEEMDKVIAVLKRVRKLKQFQSDIFKYIINPKDCNGLNALHYAVLSQSPKCVSWFIPYMQDLLVCQTSTTKIFFENGNQRTSEVIEKFTKENDAVSFQSGYAQFLRMHPPIFFSDSDRRLTVTEDWIQTYHLAYVSDNSKSQSSSSGLPMAPETKAELPKNPQETEAPSHPNKNLRVHMQMSPYELALLIWRLLDVESKVFQDILHNFATNAHTEQDPQSGDAKQISSRGGSYTSNKVHPAPADSESDAKTDDDVEVEDRQHDQLAESYRERCDEMYQILSDLEQAANKEVGIDAKKIKGLKQLANYRNRRAISRMVFPVVSYLLYVFFATLMAILMTNGLFEEPVKFSHTVMNELGWGSPQKSVSAIASFGDLTAFWAVLTGFLWESSPMARPFGEKLLFKLLLPSLAPRI